MKRSHSQQGWTIDLYLLRHGTTAWNRDRRYLGHTDVPLDEALLSELESAKCLLQSIEFSAIYCSDLKRCRETLSYVLPDASAHYHSRLRELHFGEWEGGTYEELSIIPAYCDWLDHWEDQSPPGGERGVDLRERIFAFAAEIEEAFPGPGDRFAAKSVLIVTHGGPIRMLASRYMSGLSPWEPQVHPGGLIRMMLVRGSDRQWRCPSLDDLETLR